MDLNAIETMTEEELAALLEVIKAKLEGEAPAEPTEEAKKPECREGEEEEKPEEEAPAEEKPELTEEEITELETALEKIDERKAAIKAEKRNALRERAAVEGKEIRNFKNVKENKTMDVREIRSSKEYEMAYLKALKGDETQARSLLSENASNGTMPVPTILENEIKNAWDEAAVMGLVKHSYYPGNVKVGFEYGATNAVVHTEGAAAPSEETLSIGTVELIPQNIKKWITVSDEAIEGTTIDTVGYIYKELAHKIVEKAEDIMVGKIISAPTTSTSSAPAVAELVAATVGIDTIVLAEAKLSGQARDLHVLMNRATYASLCSAALSADYAVDPFDGLKDRVVFTSALGDGKIIVGDFGYGAQANFPAGNDMIIKLDDLSLAEKDLVKIVGRQFVGMDVVAPNAFVRVVPTSTVANDQ